MSDFCVLQHSMAPATVCIDQPQQATMCAAGLPPISFLYLHFHNAMMSELESLAGWVHALDQEAQQEGQQEALLPTLLQLRDRYRFLEQLYKYHSCVEDEVVYPALDAKVKNVTLGYSMEHQDEELLLGQLAHLISAAISQCGVDQTETIRGLICKVEEIHRTLKKHLVKEEEQLLPLLMQHFSFTEQAWLVVQFLYCIPLAMVDRVLAWLKPQVPQVEQDALLSHIRIVVPDELLLQLLTSWLQPSAAEQQRQEQEQQQRIAAWAASEPQRRLLVPDLLLPSHVQVESNNDLNLVKSLSASDANGNQKQTLVSSDQLLNSHEAIDAGVASFDSQPPRLSSSLFLSSTLVHPMTGARDSPESNGLRPSRPPIKEIIHIHRTICSALKDFANEARALQLCTDVTAAQLASLVERHRFVRSVCMFHTISEEEVMYPEVRRLVGSELALASPGSVAACAHAACIQGEEEHENEVSALEGLGRLLADVRAFARRGRKEVAPMLQRLSHAAEQVLGRIATHMAREESEVFPLLERHLCATQQRAMVWRTLRAMPLRLLERVMPWVAASLSHQETMGMLNNFRLGAPEPDSALVELLTCWAARGHTGGTPDRTVSTAHHVLRSSVCVAGLPVSSGSTHLAAHSLGPSPEATETAASSHPCCQSAPAIRQMSDSHPCLADEDSQLPAKRPRIDAADKRDPGHASKAVYSNPIPEPQPHSVPGAVLHASLQLNSALQPRAEQGATSGKPLFSPIDHIFQFHTALRQELGQLEADALCVEQAVLALKKQPHQILELMPRTSSSGAQDGQPEDSPPSTQLVVAVGAAIIIPLDRPSPYASHLPPRLAAAVQALDGRFQFLWGIYRAHSRSEDEILFPALESKQALQNVSHAYTLDHQQEEQLFLDLDLVIAPLRGCEGGSSGLRQGPDITMQQALAVRSMCAAVRASLETHIRAEEAELWPLFTEHFTHDEQQYLVGVIIGRTGAQVLQALLPWISGSFSVEEKEMMMGSLRQATKNTMFDQWMDAVNHQSCSTAIANPSPQRTTAQASMPDPELARFLVPDSCSTAMAGVQTEPHTAPAPTVESSTFRPGWEDIFRMNQKQLEAAVLRVSADPHLEPSRKDYLIQNIMVSKYIVAQQQRMQKEAGQGPGNLQPVPSASAGPAALGAALQVRRTYHDAAHDILGCKHYRRRAQLVSPCCQRVFSCRLCHDEAVSSHHMDRYAVTEMVCMECGLQQPVAQTCAGCAAQLSRYYCKICHLFDDEPDRDIYHCPFCNVCRRGKGLGIDFFHCMSCNACMNLSVFKTHTCREKAMESNCPVCNEYLFDSADPIKELPCGHLLHSKCFADYTRYNYTCPLCTKSVGDMSVYFQMLDSLLASERLPLEYAGRMQQVLCNDCGKQGFARFHFAYHACPHCRSYNTRLM